MSDARRQVNQEQIACPICSASAFTPLFEKGGQRFVRCTGCGLHLINPRPLAASVMATYGGDYGALYRRKIAAKLKRSRRWVRRIHRRVHNGRWLDVGCSAGFVLQAANEFGFEPYGTDIDAEALRFAAEHFSLTQLHRGPIEGQDWPDEFFSVISAYDVIEHVPDLNVFVATLKRLLAPQGILEIRTPDVGHPRVPRDLSSWNEIKPSEHLYYFDAATLRRLLAGHGFRIVKHRLSFKPTLNIYATK
jgi:SAM-dependent methyltransferase